MVDARLEALDRLALRLEAGLALFDGGEAERLSTAESAWSACTSAFEELRTLNESLADRTASPEVAARLNHVRRLYTVAASLMSREREAIGSELSKLVDVKQRVRELAKTGSRADTRGTGRSCDVSG